MRRLTAGAALAASVLCAGCAEGLTELIVVMTVSAELENAITSVEYRIDGGPSGALESIERGVLCPPFPHTFALAPRRGDADRVVEIELRGYGISGRELGRLRTRAGYRSGDVKMMTIELGSCAGECLVDRTDDDLPDLDREPPQRAWTWPDILFPSHGALVYENVRFTATAGDSVWIEDSRVEPDRCVVRRNFDISDENIENPEIVIRVPERGSVSVRVQALTEDLQQGPTDLIFSRGVAYGLMSRSIRGLDLTNRSEDGIGGTWNVLEATYRGLLASPEDGRAFAVREGRIEILDLVNGDAELLTELSFVPGVSITPRLAWDRAGRRIIAAQQRAGQKLELLAVDPHSGDISPIFEWPTPGGFIARDLEVHPNGDRVFAADWGMVLQFELSTGAISEVTCNFPIVAGAAVELDPDREELLLIDTLTRKILALSLTSSTCTDFAQLRPAEKFSQPARITYEDHKVWVYDSDYVTLFEIERRGGAQKMRARPSVGKGPVLSVGSSIEYSEARRELILPLDFPPRIIGVDLSNGDRRVLSSEANGLAGRFFDVAVRKDGRKAIAVTWEPPALFEVDLDSGAARFITTPPPMREIALSKNEEEVYLLLPPSREIAAIDIQSGAIRTIAKTAAFATYLNMALDLDHDRLVLAGDPSGTLLSVGVERGDVVELVRVAYESILDGTVPTSIDIEPGSAHIFLKAGRAVIAVDASTGLATIITGTDSAALSFEPGPISADWRRGVLYSLDRSVNAIFAVDIAGGSRAIVSR